MLFFLLAVGAFLYFLVHQFYLRRKDLPPGPMPLPFIGNAHQIETAAPHRTFHKWSKQYGGVYTAWLGLQANIIIADLESLKKYMFGRNGDILTGRPENFLFEELFKGRSGILFADGNLWREQRRFALHVLRDFGFGRSLMEEGINDELSTMLKDIDGEIVAAPSGKAILKTERWELMLELAVTSLIAKVVVGHGFKRQDNDYKIVFRALKGFELNFQKPAVQLIQAIPPARHIPFIKDYGYNDMMNRIFAFHALVRRELAEHQRDFKPDMETKDFITAFLKEMHRREEKGEEMGGFSTQQLAGVAFDLWLAGTNTTVVTLRWGIFFILHHPEVQERISKELEAFYGSSDRAVSMSEKNHLPYLSATLQEIQRCANIVPVNVPHAPTEDMMMEGFLIPKGTAVLPEFSCLFCDPTVFAEPEKFSPERYLEADGVTPKKTEGLMPFSLGKRVCAGEALARMELFMFLASLLRRYKFKPDPSAPLAPMWDEEGKLRSFFPPTYSYQIERR